MNAAPRNRQKCLAVVLVVFFSCVAEGMVLGVHQDDFRPSHGNALQACVASILELPLHAVPNFISAPDPYASLRSFLQPHGLGFLKVEIPAAIVAASDGGIGANAAAGGRPDSSDALLPFAPCGDDAEAFCILAGPSPRGAHRHAIVGRAVGRAVAPAFDPHPDGTMLAGRPVWAGFFVALDPARLARPVAAPAASADAGKL